MGAERRQYFKSYYWKNRLSIRKRHHRWRRENLEHMRAYDRTYYHRIRKAKNATA